MTSSITSRTFGFLYDRKPIEAWTLCGRGGLVMEAITYGATVTRLLVPDRDGHMADVVLGFNDLESYVADRAYFGAVIGRVAGRIAGAQFILDGITYDLAKNDFPNHLHGGVAGFNKKTWIASPMRRRDGAPSLRLTYCSPDGEEGYPGNVTTAVQYTVTDDNRVLVQTESVSDRLTPVSLTVHPYFHLGGEGTGSIADHELRITADEFVPTDEHMAPVGPTESVIGRSNDFRQIRHLGDAIPFLFRNHGDLYHVRRSKQKGAGSKPVPAARLVHPASGRTLDVFTTEPYIQLYTGAGLDGSVTGKSGAPYLQYAGVALECEGYPDGVNVPDMGDILLRPGEIRQQTTAYAFSTRH
jgi:aldose 1-epimerase